MDITTVPFRDCTCPDTPHAKDTASFPTEMPLIVGIEVVALITGPKAVTNGEDIQISSAWPAYVHAVTGWNLLDKDGPVPCTREALDGLGLIDAYELADRIDDTYGRQAADFLGARMRKLTPSANGPTTAGSTTPPGSSSSPRAPRKRSS